MRNAIQAPHGSGDGASRDTLDRTIDRAFAAIVREPTVDVRERVLSRLDDNAAAKNRRCRIAGWRGWALASAGVVGAAALATAVLRPPSYRHVSHPAAIAMVGSGVGDMESETVGGPAMPAAAGSLPAETARIRVAAYGPPGAASPRPQPLRGPGPVLDPTAVIDDPLFLAARMPDVEPISVDLILLTPIEATPLNEPPIVVPPIVLPPVGASRVPASSPVSEGERR